MPYAITPWMSMALIAIGSALCLPAGAQSMYRCGNTYQAFPCETGQGKVIGSTGAQHSSYQPVSDAECAQRGAESLKIVWRREAGLPREKALAEVDDKPLSSAQKTDAKKLVADVYHRRGSAPEVRASIEAECAADKEREARAAAMHRGAPPPGPQRPSPDPALKNAGNPATANAGADRKEQTPASAAASKKMLCQSLHRQLDDISQRQRAGGDVAAMEQLRQDQRDAQREANESGC